MTVSQGLQGIAGCLNWKGLKRRSLTLYPTELRAHRSCIGIKCLNSIAESEESVKPFSKKTHTFFRQILAKFQANTAWSRAGSAYLPSAAGQTLSVWTCGGPGAPGKRPGQHPGRRTGRSRRSRRCRCRRGG